MKRRRIMSSKIIILSTLIVALAVICQFKGTVIAGQDKSIKLGLSLCYTGALSAHGAQFANGMRERLMWTNKEGGIIYKNSVTSKVDRVKIDVVWEDNAYNAAKSVAMYKRFRASGVRVISGYGSTPGEATAGSASRDKIPVIQLYCYASPAGYEPKPQFYSAGLGTITEDFMAPAKWFITNWKETRPPRLGVLALGVPSWRSINDPKGVKAHVERLGAKFVGVEWMPMIYTDSSVELRRLIDEKKADFIMVFGAMAHGIVVAKDLARLGVDLNKVTVVLNASAIDESFIKAIPKESEGIYGTNYFALPYEDDVPGVKVAKKIATWRGRSPAKVTKTYIEGVACAYIVEAGIKAALEKVGFDALTTVDIKNAFFSLKDVKIDGLLPYITVRDPGYPRFVYWMRIARCEAGRYKLVSDWLEIPEIKEARR